MPEFVEMFKFTNRRDADRAFSLLISKSFLRKATRHALRSSYSMWKRNEGDQFWASQEAKTIVATDLIVGSVPKARKLALGDSYQTRSKTNMQVAPTTNADKTPATSAYHDSNESSARPQRASHITFDVGASAVEREHYQDTTVRRLVDVAVGNKRRQDLLEASQEHEQPRQKRRSEQQQQQKSVQQHGQQKEEEDLSRHNFFDPSTIDPCELEIESVDVGKSFRQLQEEAADVVNDLRKSMTLELLPFFFAANHIWDVDYKLPGMTDEDHDTIQHALSVPIARLSHHHLWFCRDLELDLTSEGYIKSRDTKSRDLDALLVLFQQTSQKLPKKYLPFKHLKNEDTHAHSVLDVLLTYVFPATNYRYELHWANRPTAGSCDRRNGDAYKPDATVLKDGFELAFMEVKPPKEEHHQRAYLEDVWALSGLAKDNIDLHLRHSRFLTTTACIQVFGE
ncbi:hypothetical protein BGW42_000663 [Actinomortierella wolfii]|nr:hypothetical protein BGW42_000663 [Actinomortierella wolfii]